MKADRWPKVNRAASRLASAPLFIDDSSDLGVLELRAKARRLAARHGLGLVIVDYLQLMRAEGRTDSRVEQIGQISRGLKILARELDVPVVAISQLSRAVESRNPPEPMLSDLRESGCLTGDTRVFLPRSGTYRPIRELVGEAGVDVLGLDPTTWRFEERRVTNAFATGRKPIYRLSTRLGRSIRATANHRFLTFDGWRRLDELQTGVHLALPRRLGGASNPSMSGAERIRAHLATRTANPNRDIIPKQARRSVVLPAMQASGMTARKLAPGLETSYAGSSLYEANLSRARATRVATVVDSEELRRLASSDVYWDPVVSIEPDGEEQVYDLTVEGLHNFVADDIVVHNSIEQDADVVMFVYRDEYYNQESERLGEADLIVAKHRNGPIGRITLSFQSRYPKFASLYREHAVAPGAPEENGAG